MKQYWEKLARRIDALSLRERGMIFVATAAVLLVLVNTLVLDPQFVRQKQISDQIKLEQSQIAVIQTEIDRKMGGAKNDPDAPYRERLQQLKQQSFEMHNQLQDMRKGLVAPDKMAALLEDMLRRNGRLQLISLKTLPVSNLTDTKESGTNVANKTIMADGTVSTKTDAPNSASGAIYKHGVEIVVQGSYLDIVSTMSALEAMPWQLFWGKVALTVEEYPKSTLTLTLYTLSLDEKWLNL